MGWLDNSTNNIILDAVLTDYGRQQLAIGGTAFNISQFALGDDEVDYGIITKYGRTVGREKIEKNTPVFEAFTNQNLAQKYKTFGIEVPILYIPKIKLESPSSPISLTSNGSTTLTVKQVQPSGAAGEIPASLKETNFLVYIPDIFLYLPDERSIATTGGQGTNKVTTYTKTKTYTVPTTTGTEPQISPKLQVQTIGETTWSVYGRITGSSTIINTNIRVVGALTGIVLDIPVTITR